MKPYSKTVEKNLLKCWELASRTDKREGLRWYQTGHDLCATMGKLAGISSETACGVVAALSPGKSWEQNLEEAGRFIAAFKAGDELPIVGAYGRANVRKAERILKGEAPLDVLQGPKVRAFYSNLSNPSGQEVCIDRHAKAAALGITLPEPGWAPAKQLGITNVVRPGEYPWIADHYVKAAAKVGVRPCEFQAVCWVTWKRLKAELNAEAGVKLLKAA